MPCFNLYLINEYVQEQINSRSKRPECDIKQKNMLTKGHIVVAICEKMCYTKPAIV